ncbi:uncharacterized protein LOC133805484 [Humulus lupulus]|uniref:uncharacterized protein LOC133805484 n=1 Tax=Humulus lupulus TaxID=3486 RepID=UPI002B41332A|nr:uncharacterized protein LOC133805484 [Humulus lupulus]
MEDQNASDLINFLYEDKKLLESIDDQIKSNNHPSNKEEYTKIQKIQTIMLNRTDEDFKQNFIPRFMAIGPVHYGNTHLVNKRLKISLAAKFIGKSKGMSEQLLGKIKANIKELEDHFHANVNKYRKEDALARILFRDGLSVLQFIHCVVRKDFSGIEINNGQVVLFQNDLFLLENQIPFKVFKLLMEPPMNEEMCKPYKESLRLFIINHLMEPNSSSPKVLLEDEWYDKIKPAHLLDLLRIAFLDDMSTTKSSSEPSHETSPHNQRSAYCNIVRDKLTLLMTRLNERITVLKGSTCTKTSPGNNQRTFRNVQDLKAAGIRMKPSNTLRLKDLSFQPGCWRGTLKLRSLTVNESTELKLFNLVAYEMCGDHNNKNECGVTSYVSFLDLLIENEQDVKDLRSANILHNCLSSDVQVVDLFDKIGNIYNLVPHDDYYKEVKNQIQEHCKKNINVWFTQICENYFSSPLKVMAWVGAIVALLLTAFGTWFTIYPTD